MRKLKNAVVSVLRRTSTRLMLWYGILRKIRGFEVKVYLGLMLSALIDVLFHTIRPLPVARSYVSGVVGFKFNNAWVYFYTRGFTDDLYHIVPGRERDVNKLILSCLKGGDVFIDVGANIGYYTILAGKIVESNGLVVSIEPVPETARVLSFNLKLNNLSNVKVIQKAAWRSNEPVALHCPSGFFGLASIRKFPLSATLLVEGMPLDDLLGTLINPHSRVNLLKIDAEGSEYHILEGARRLLQITKCVILEASSQKDKILRLLEDEGFKVRKLSFTTYILAYKKVKSNNQQ